MKRYCFTTQIVIILLLCTNGIQAQNTHAKQREPGAVVFDLPRMDDIIIKKDIPYQDVSGSTLKMDIYYPPDFDFKSKIPAIIIVLGYPDMAGKKLLGSEFKNYIQFVSWCKIISASGMAAIAYESTNPEQDIISLTNYLKTNEDKLKIDNSRIGAYTCSAHTPTTITTLLNGSNNIFKCAVVYYGFFLTNDFKYLPQIDTLSQNMGFKTPRLSEPNTWKKDIPIMIVRAGKDNVPYINQTLSSFYEQALNQNLPITLINYSNGVHGFEASNDNETTRQIIKTTLEFWKFNLKQ
jgi:dienelactone hydrolase